MKTLLSALLGGVLFGAGLVISGMTEPANVVAFLTLGEGWNVALAFVMGSALIVTAIGYRLAGKRSQPLFVALFQIPSNSNIDVRLLIGAALFGIGWGIAGYCPGPAIVGAFTLDDRALLFIGGYLFGVLVFELFDRSVGARLATDG